ncbi:MAG: 1-deoxy-D-xylulose-5-phosphate reductoisomerase [Desulfobacteraceae bacterium]|jgi:1-deoxy-D-xylulose-5-phosphate reductoisomerase
MKTLALLGSTGSIGCNTLNIVSNFPDDFRVAALTAKKNIDLLARQIKAFSPEMVAVYDASLAQKLKGLLAPSQKVEILYGAQGYRAAAAWDGVDMTVGAMVGAAGLEPTLAAISAGKDIAIANKETLVMAGALVIAAAERKGVRMLPIDSEHSAIFQCLQGHRRQDLKKIFLTASGGPFLNESAEAFDRISPEDALKHPNWEMGAKITIDSATLMNKGLEVIEAKWLFDVSIDEIEVVVHPQSIIHSMVAYCDGSILAQMGIPDMQEAIAYALAYPERIPLKQPLPDLVAMDGLTFSHPDLKRFPCLQLAFDACRSGGTMPATMNAANEVAVEAFLASQIPFTSIPEVIDATMNEHNLIQEPDLDTVLDADKWSRQKARSLVAERTKI